MLNKLRGPWFITLVTQRNLLPTKNSLHWIPVAAQNEKAWEENEISSNVHLQTIFLLAAGKLSVTV